MKQSGSVVIVGGGLGGLATAALLAKDGYRVTVVEKNEQLGGRASRLTTKGFTFDLGPSWYMMPDVFERFFAEFRKKPQDYLNLVKVKPQYRIFFSDYTHVDVSDNLDTTRALFESIEPGAAKQFDRYLAEGKLKYDVATKDVLYKNVDHIWDFFSLSLLKNGLKLDPFTSMETYVARFFKSEKLQQIIQYTLVFLGGAPSNVPALYSLMSHVDFNLGTYYPIGGFYSLTEALVKLGTEHGVSYRLNAPVASISVTGDQVSGIVLSTGEQISADVVISNADYAHTEDLLSDQAKRSQSKQEWKNKILAPSAFLIFAGVKGSLPTIKHHNIYFGKNWIEHFETIFKNRSWPKNPSLYINKPTATDASVAPKGHENLMILVPIAPFLAENERSKRQYADFIYHYIKLQLGVDIKKNLVVEHIFSVSDFESRYNSLGGNALGGLAHTLFQTGPWRPPNKAKHLKNLFFVGANTVPGIGVPPAIISAHLARERVEKLLKKSR